MASLGDGSWANGGAKFPPLKALGVEGARVAKKKHRFRPGTRAKIEIRQQQRSEKPAIPRTTFIRIMRDIMHRVSTEHGDTYRISRVAFDALGEESERLVSQLFSSAEHVRMARKRQTLQPIDIQTALLITQQLSGSSF